MKKLAGLLLLVAVLGCQKSETPITTGVKGSVMFGAGDCMPVIDPSAREYEPYTGYLYFMPHEYDPDFVPFYSIHPDAIKAESYKTFARNGNYAVELPVDTFWVMLPDFFNLGNKTRVIVKENTVIEQDVYLWKCTTY
ncbi:MAG: hypothetical protein R6U66_08420 [Bacteroidales bacterium]